MPFLKQEGRKSLRFFNLFNSVLPSRGVLASLFFFYGFLLISDNGGAVNSVEDLWGLCVFFAQLCVKKKRDTKNRKENTETHGENNPTRSPFIQANIQISEMPIFMG
ncbi:hypothetical protein D1614_14890 [Maribellus luteus]|uniref:Uncharacterized protein n=1 Tax=Maribellus luteus TaxID=2305463 RepID=A0A399SVE6_9BACT|nr:hypothetical protein [Maribellus luteus]RIJ47398.1 hypothetical protein D1614_14890 [Maribellus luteus]